MPGRCLVEGLRGPPAPPVVDLTIRANADINPNPMGTPVSVARSPLFAQCQGKVRVGRCLLLMQREAADAGHGKRRRREEAVSPSGRDPEGHADAEARVRFIGIAVLFRDIDRAQRRHGRAHRRKRADAGCAISISGTRAALVPA